MKIRATLDVVEISQDLGDVRFLWANCGGDELCHFCREKGNVQGCRRQFQLQDTVIRGEASEFFYLTMPDGTIILATNVKLLE